MANRRRTLAPAAANTPPDAAFRALVERAGDVVVIADADLVIGFVSESAARAFGFDPSTLVGQPLASFGGGEDTALVEALQRRALSDGIPHMVEWDLRAADGGTRIVESVVTAELENPDIAGFVISTRDVTDRVALERQLRHQAFHDPLTGLANRALFQDRAVRALARANLNGGAVGVLLIDLDTFKSVNDSLGHSVGDGVLSVVAERLEQATDSDCTVTRFGGDEFAVLIEQLYDESEAVDLAERLQLELRKQIVIDGVTHILTASIGVAVGHGEITVEGLLRDADAAMYVAKSSGKNSTRVFVPSMYADTRSRFELQVGLRRALEHEEFELHYQPAFDVQTGAIRGFEALLRWARPEEGMVEPESFLPLAEETGLLVYIGRWALRAALSQLTRFDEVTDMEDLTIAVNVSRRELLDTRFVGEVASALEESGIAAERLVLEVTESILIDAPDDLVAVLGDLRLLGVQVAIDDFGTGYASLSNLQRLPVTMLKIDKVFVQAGRQARGRSVLEATMRVAQSLSLVTVAEGAEEPSQLAALCELGCDLVQGYLLSRPINATEAAVLIGRPDPSAANVLPLLSGWLRRHVLTDQLLAAT